MRRTGRIICALVYWLITLVLGISLICNVYIIAKRLMTDTVQPDVFGWSWAVVVSGSMEPAISVDDLIIVHRENDYHVGDVISYKSGSSIVTHRILDKSEDFFITGGDANNTPDFQPVRDEQIIGKVRLTVPKLGFVIGFLQTPLGMTCLVLLGILLMEASFLMSKNRAYEKRGKHENYQEYEN